MGQKFATYTPDGQITGFYDSIDSPVPAGAASVELSFADWQTAIANPGCTIVNGALIMPAPPPLSAVQAMECAGVDSCADAVYVEIGGPSPGRLAEYQQASTDASAFAAAGYTGNVPVTVSCWAQANTGWTNQEAAEDIIATASKWIAALQAIRSARLLGKAAVMAATTVADAQSAATTAISNIHAVAATA